MRRVLKNETLQREFEQKGYVKVKLFDADEVESLKRLHNSLQPNERFNSQEKNVKYHFSFLDTNKEYKRKVFSELSAVFQPKLENYLEQYEPLVINFVNKEPGLGEVPIHQNWNFVDETRYVSVSVWAPLVDVEEINGTIEMIEGSHNIFRNILRSPSIPWFFTGYEKHLIDNYCKPIEVKAGEALIFDDSIIHYSKTNHGTYDRLVIQVISKPKEVQAKHFYMKKKIFGTEVEELDVDSDFFLNFKYHITDRPEGALNKKKISYKLPDINKKKFDEILHMNSHTINSD